MRPEAVRTVFMGSPEFAAPSLQGLAASKYNLLAVYTQPDRPAGRGRAPLAPPVKRAAQALGISVSQPERLRGTEVTARLRELCPDLIVVAAYGQVLRRAVVDLPRYGCINVHASLLPRHRGASPIAAALLAGDRETGVAIMRIDAGIDTGPVLARRAIAIDDQDTTGLLTERLARLGVELLLQTLPGWIDGELAAEPQSEAGATFAPLIAKAAGEIDWRKPALQLRREVRAYNPWPLSSTSLNGQQLQILSCQALPDGLAARGSATTGTVVRLPDGATVHLRDQANRAAFGVITGDGLLVPLTVRRAGRNAVSAAEFERGTRDLIGSILGAS